MCFPTHIGHFLFIYMNSSGFRAPPLLEGCGLRFEGVGQVGWMWEGTRTIEATRDKGDPAGASRTVLKQQTPSTISILWPPSSFFVATGTFETYDFDAHIPSPSRQPLKPAKHVIKTCHFTAYIHPNLQLPWHPYTTPYPHICDHAIDRTHCPNPHLPWASFWGFVSCSAHLHWRYELVGGS